MTKRPLEIIPTVLAYDEREFTALFGKVVPISPWVQIDLMDGKFVETASIPLPSVPDVRERKGTSFEAHLMVQDPSAWIPGLARRGFRRIIVHYESLKASEIVAVAREVRALGMQAMLACNPETRIASVVPHVAHFDGALVLGVHPGRNGAPYVEETPARVRELAKMCKDAIIQVDGGMTPSTIKAVVTAGAARVNSGSYVAKAADPARALKELYDAAR